MTAAPEPTTARRTTPWTVLLVDDHDMVMQGVKGIIDTEPLLEVVGQAKDGLEAVEKAGLFSPDLILMDINMPKLDGIEATQKIKSFSPTTPIMLLTGQDARENHYRAIMAGADEYTLKETDGDTLIDTMFAVIDGETNITESLYKIFVERMKADAREAEEKDLQPSFMAPDKLREFATGWTELSGREKQVLSCIADGWTNPEIGQRLHIEVTTVKKHCASIFEKLKVSGRVQATKAAILLGLGSNTLQKAPQPA